MKDVIIITFFTNSFRRLYSRIFNTEKCRFYRRRILFYDVHSTIVKTLNNLFSKNSLKMPTNISKKYISKIFLQVYITELRLHKNYSKVDFLPQKGVECVIAFSDTDNFKTINDKFGHSYGDRVLRIIGTTLQNFVRLKALYADSAEMNLLYFSLLRTVFQWKI